VAEEVLVIITHLLAVTLMAVEQVVVVVRLLQRVHIVTEVIMLTSAVHLILIQEEGEVVTYHKTDLQLQAQEDQEGLEGLGHK
jgi:hypothetical protein